MGIVPRDRASSSRRLSIFCGVVSSVVVALAACGRAPARNVTLTSASLSTGPQALPPAAHTVDSDGFVDNAGRTNTERNRTEASGMRPTESGSQVPTGTPGSGFPLPLGPEPAPRERERPANRWALGTPQPGGVSARVVAQKVARAFCDREWSCGRVSVTEAWASKARCMEHIHSRFFEDLGHADCPDAFDPNVVPSCLSAIRRTSCDAKMDSLSSVSDCIPNTLCLPR